jgi:pimeloyl-ACP methyl ester carboxylesterase
MAIVGLIAGWVLSIVAFMISLMILGMGGRIQFVILLSIALVFFPPLSGIFKSHGIQIAWWMRVIAVAVLYAAFMLSMVLNPAKSIYKSPAYREKLIEIYDEKLAQWPTPYESRYIETEYGKVHVIVSGPEDGYPVMLIHASGIAGWSWIFNVGALNTKYRTYAVDNVGEAGKNELKKPHYIPKTGPEIAAYYTDISNKLGFTKSHVVGASIGGFIATNYAIYAPERVNRLVLLGSMGYGFTPKTIGTMVIAQGYPLKAIQDATFTWAFGNAQHVTEAFGPWFRLVMKGMIPTPIAPASLKPEELKRITTPTLTYLGNKDAVVGNAEKASKLARNIPNSIIRIVESGHLMGAELSEDVNRDMMNFFAEADTSSKEVSIEERETL